MATIEYTLWRDDAAFIKDHKYPKSYFTPEKYDTAKNPLESLVVIPGLQDFFGTKVCNIFIVGLPFGWDKSGSSWQQNWPPAGYDDAVQRHIDSYNMYGKYETHVFMDFNIVQKVMDANSDSKFRDMMNTTKTNMETMCGTLSAYGFMMEPDIIADVGPDHFYTILDTFYK